MKKQRRYTTMPMTEEVFRAACNELADAIVAGSDLTEPMIANLLTFTQDSEGKTTCVEACVLGAAYFAKKKPEHPVLISAQDVREAFPVLREQVYVPGTNCTDDFFWAIANMYDLGIMPTRKKVANEFVRVARHASATQTEQEEETQTHD